MRPTTSPAVLVLLGAFAGGLVATWLTAPNTSVHAEAPPLPAVPASVEMTLPSFEPVVAKVSASVVSVDAVKPQTSAAKTKPQEESGSGVLVQFDGVRGVYAVTNNHVIAGAKAEDVTVTLADGRVLRPSRVLTDVETDIALLALDAADLIPAKLGDSDRLRVGQWVVAVGSPFGLNQTVTHGIISAKDRGQISLGAAIRIKEFLQTDAAINPGSSGGPLVSLDGVVIGINTAIASNNGNNSGVAFSIPVNLVRRVARELLSKGAVERGYLGVQLAPTLEPAEALRLGLDRVRGALVESVNPGSPAATAGLLAGDVILKLEAVDLRDENHLINLISNLPARHKARLNVWRAKASQTVDVVIGEWVKAK